MATEKPSRPHRETLYGLPMHQSVSLPTSGRHNLHRRDKPSQDTLSTLMVDELIKNKIHLPFVIIHLLVKLERYTQNRT